MSKKKQKLSSHKIGPIFSPKLGEEQKKKKKKKVFTQIWSHFSPKMETQIGQGEKNSCSKTERILAPKLNATASTLPGPPRPGPGYNVPPEPRSRRPCPQLDIHFNPGPNKTTQKQI